MKNILYILMVSVAGWSCTQLKSETKQIAERSITVVVRGSHRGAPENTFAAMKKAVEQGAHYIEVDWLPAATAYSTVFMITRWTVPPMDKEISPNVFQLISTPWMRAPGFHLSLQVKVFRR